MAGFVSMILAFYLTIRVGEDQTKLIAEFDHSCHCPMLFPSCQESQRECEIHAVVAANSTMWTNYFWIAALVVNFVGSAFCTSICIRVKKNPQVAKARADLRNSQFVASATESFTVDESQFDNTGGDEAGL